MTAGKGAFDANTSILKVDFAIKLRRYIIRQDKL